MLTLFNKTKLNSTNEHDIENLNNSQAKDEAGSGRKESLQSSKRQPDKTSHAKRGTGTDTDVRRTSVADSAFSAQSPNPLPLNPPQKPIQPRVSDLLPENKREHILAKLAQNKQQLAQNKQQLAQNRQQNLFNIIHGEPFGAVFMTDESTDSLYLMISTMTGKMVPDPCFEQKTPADIGTDPPEIPMYDAFVFYINTLWEHLKRRGMLTGGSKAVNDFILHRAAYIFLTGDHTKAGVQWFDPVSSVVYLF